jgi:hypothetical protein
VTEKISCRLRICLHRSDDEARAGDTYPLGATGSPLGGPPDELCRVVPGAIEIPQAHNCENQQSTDHTCINLAAKTQAKNVEPGNVVWSAETTTIASSGVGFLHHHKHDEEATANVEGEDLDNKGGLQVDDVLSAEARARRRVIVVQRLHKLHRLQQQEGERACHPLRRGHHGRTESNRMGFCAFAGRHATTLGFSFSPLPCPGDQAAHPHVLRQRHHSPAPPLDHS